MSGALYLVAVFAWISAALGFYEIVQTWASSATVFQQISARVDVGLSLIVAVLASGFGALLQRADRFLAHKPATIAAATHPLTIEPGRAPSTPTIWQSSSPDVSVHRDIPFRKVGEEYVATVDGTEIRAYSPDLIRTRITNALARSGDPA